MLYRIADLLVEIPEAGGIAPRCQDYLASSGGAADIVIHPEEYRPHLYPAETSAETVAYMESASQFYKGLLDFGGMYFHASSVELEGRAYLFSGDSGMGKSTHTRLWLSEFGERARVFNDDKPPVRKIDGVWYAYGAPWCGKDGININRRVPIAGICFLVKANENSIRRLSVPEAMKRLMKQTLHGFKDEEMLDKSLAVTSELLTDIPMYELLSKPEPEAARLSYETMRKGAEEIGL